MYIFDDSDKINKLRAVTLMHGIKLYLKAGIQPSRQITPTYMRNAASHYTGKKYKRGAKGLQDALSDLRAIYPDHYGKDSQPTRLRETDVGEGR